MVDLVNQYASVKNEIDQAIQQVIDSSQFINGPAVTEFVEQLSNYLHVPHSLGCGNGTDAIQIALMALDLAPGDEIITTPFTFVASVEVISLLKLKPIFVDIDPATFNIDVSKVEAAITEKTKAIIPVHLFGQSVDMQSLMGIARRHNLRVIEDNAQSIGCKAIIDGERHRTGTIGDFGTLSFFPSKNLGCYGDGGALSTRSKTLYNRAKMIAKHGSKVKYFYDAIGINSRLDSIQASILSIKLAHLDHYISRRQEVASYYDSKLSSISGLIIPKRVEYSNHVFHQYTIRIREGRDELQLALKENQIPSMIYYPKPLHLQPAYSYLGYTEGSFPEAELASKEVLSLPMHTELDSDQLHYITNSIRSFFT